MYNLSYSGTLYIESHEDILNYCSYAGIEVSELNKCIRLENSVDDCTGIFKNLKSFNKSVIFPSSVRKIDAALEGCTSFSQYIFIDYKLLKEAGGTAKDLVKKLGLADTYPEDRFIVTNSNKYFDLYLGKDMNFPDGVPGIIQLLRDETPEELLRSKMFFRNLPEFRFPVKTVYVYATSDDIVNKAVALLDAAMQVNAEMFINTGFKIITKKDNDSNIDEIIKGHCLEKADVKVGGID